MNAALIVAVLGVAGMAAQAAFHAAERRDLLNRLMAKDYREYREPAEKGGHVGNALKDSMRRRNDSALRAGGETDGDGQQPRD